jgi:hypothetical protein
MLRLPVMCQLHACLLIFRMAFYFGVPRFTFLCLHLSDELLFVLVCLSSCSAFMIGDGKLLTNAHCVEHSTQVSIGQVCFLVFICFLSSFPFMLSNFCSHWVILVVKYHKFPLQHWIGLFGFKL